jgi:hypothetical protein
LKDNCTKRFKKSGSKVVRKVTIYGIINLIIKVMINMIINNIIYVIIGVKIIRIIL